MFDPIHIGAIEQEHVRVIKILASKRPGYQIFKAVVLLQESAHALIFKPNPDGKRDQIVADRLKWLGSIEPMNTFGCSLKFGYFNDQKIETPSMEYYAFASSLQEVESDDWPIPLFNYVRRNPDLGYEFWFEVCKIVVFRYIIGCTNTDRTHIIVRNGKPLSISETKLDTSKPEKDFINRLINHISEEMWNAAGMEVVSGMSFDAVRGIVLQTRKYELPERKLKSKGPLYSPARSTIESIEQRTDLIRDCFDYHNISSRSNSVLQAILEN